jgi:hypothetical protein
MDTFDLSDLAGRPVVVMVVAEPQSAQDVASLDGTSIARDVAAFGGLWRDLGGRAAFVLVAGSSPTSEALAFWASQLASASFSDRDVSVVIPGESWRWPVPEATLLVLDAAGVVQRIDADGIPTPAELAPVLEGTAP